MEVLVSTALLGVLASVSLWALGQANIQASGARLNTGAQTAAQNQIDLVLADAPFNPQLGSGDGFVPPVLKVQKSAPKNVAIYTEPGDSTPLIVYGQMVTEVKKVVTPLVSGRDLNLYSAWVVITYQFRNRSYKVELDALRASDV